MPRPWARAVDGQPAVGVALVRADLPPHAGREDLGAAARQRIEARRHQLAQHLLVGHPVEIGEERDLDRREALQVDGGLDLLQPAQQRRVVVERQVRVEAVDDVDLGDGLVGAHAELVQRLLERERVGVLVAGLQARERAEQAVGHADVRGLEADVVVVEGQAAVALLALAVGQPAEGQRVRALEQADAVLERQPLAGVQFLPDVQQPRARNPGFSQHARHRAFTDPFSRHGSSRRTQVMKPVLLIVTCYTPRLATDVPVGRPGKLGEKPTRSRHCMRGACAVATAADAVVRHGAGEALEDETRA